MDTTQVATQLVESLAEHQLRVVFAESCTGGMISAELAKVPGVSEWLCGSAVTYRGETKTQWLGVSDEQIRQHSAVCGPVAIQMAEGVLRNTPEASLSASITGHLGPAAPADLDGVVFVGIAVLDSQGQPQAECSRHQLVTAERSQRQAEATELVLRLVLDKVGS